MKIIKEFEDVNFTKALSEQYSGINIIVSDYFFKFGLGDDGKLYYSFRFMPIDSSEWISFENNCAGIPFWLMVNIVKEFEPFLPFI